MRGTDRGVHKDLISALGRDPPDPQPFCLCGARILACRVAIPGDIEFRGGASPGRFGYPACSAGLSFGPDLRPFLDQADPATNPAPPVSCPIRRIRPRRLPVYPLYAMLSVASHPHDAAVVDL